MTPHDRWLDAVSYEQDEDETEDEREQREIDRRIRADEVMNDHFNRNGGG